jgi:type II secretory ATPase GspE/PulE/Tfp pilus assembly ATPase PilB-like protein
MANAKRNLAGNLAGMMFRKPAAVVPIPSSESAEAGLLVPPQELHNAIAVDLHGRARATVYVSQAFCGHPLFLTWIASNRDRGITIQVNHVGVEEIADYRSRFGTPDLEENIDQAVRNQAIDLLKQAAAYKASDMHIRVNGEYGEVQIGVNGELRILHRLTHQAGDNLIRALYQGVARIKSDSLKPTEYQNAQIPGDVFGVEVGITSIRVVRGPCHPVTDGGQFMTLRLQYHSSMSHAAPAVSQQEDREELPPLPYPKPPAGELNLLEGGYTAAQIEKLAMLMSAPSGLVLFTGPTGSGKTTTMAQCMAEIARRRPEDRQVTVEDPVEYPMEWAVQLGFADSRSDQEAGAAYLEAVRVMLRMAPKVILIGEIRGPEVASAALNAAITGHLGISTLHVDDPYLFVERLEFMDRKRLQRGVFCDPKIIRGVIAQRLIPHLCPKCRVPLSKSQKALPTRILKGLAAHGPLDHVALRGSGCKHCAGVGTLGRKAVAEIVVMDEDLAADFISHGTAVARANYRKRADADPSMLEAAIAHVLAGDVDPRAVEKNIDLILPR